MNDRTLDNVSAKERPLVTLALFSYNQEKYVRDAVAGALAQTYSPMEIILSDDCSTDRTFEIMNEVAREYKGPHKIALNRNPSNLGIAAHINRVMELANGELIVVAAGDDISLHQRVSVLVAAWLSEKKPPAMCSQAMVISDGGKTISERFHGYDGAYPEHDEVRETSIKRLLTHDHCILLGCTEAWTPSIFEIFGPLNDDVVHEDNVISLRAWLLGRIVFLNDSLVQYRTHDANIAFQATKAPRTLADFEKRESAAARRQNGKATNLKQHRTDLCNSEKRRLISTDAFAEYSRIINKRLPHHMEIGMWWELGFQERSRVLFNSIVNNDLDTVAWAAPRLFGMKSFAASRVLLAWGSRTVRKIRITAKRFNPAQ